MIAMLDRPQTLSGERENTDGLLAALVAAWQARRMRRQTLAELRALGIREREDIGIAGEDLTAVVRRAARAA